ncbi:ATP-binding protein [Amphibiibacter pelophylacis]|uniref:ATP-binding protein n=1 Tax=Amphibiibacter pelophylacis TaxID=1799477 RepID=A0ACC6NZQ8_9BURK
MRSLYLRIYATVLAVLLLFSVVGGWIVHEQMERRASEVRQRVEHRFQQRSAAWAELIEESLPEGDTPRAEQSQAVLDWSQRLGIPLALDDAAGERMVTAGHSPDRPIRWMAFDLRDKRTLWLGLKPGRKPAMEAGDSAGAPHRPDGGPQGSPHGPPGLLPALIPGADSTVNLLVMLVALFVAVALGAWPAVRSLTRRLVDLNAGVQNFGRGDLSVRVPVRGRDEVAALAKSFNQAAQQVQDLVQAHRSLLANASHELRSPLARMKMALAMLPGASSTQQTQLSHEINTDIAELDALVEEVLLSSRIEAGAVPARPEALALDGLFDEVMARAGLAPTDVEIVPPLDGTHQVLADERLLLRAVRNLVENACRYGGSEVRLRIAQADQPGLLHIDVLDRGPGIAPELRERIFEAFYRLPGHAEHAGGVGLGLALVRQIAQRQNARVQCLARDDGPGSCFRLIWPMAA